MKFRMRLHSNKIRAHSQTIAYSSTGSWYAKALMQRHVESPVFQTNPLGDDCDDFTTVTSHLLHIQIVVQKLKSKFQR